MQALVETTEYTVIMCLWTCKTNDQDYKHISEREQGQNNSMTALHIELEILKCTVH